MKNIPILILHGWNLSAARFIPLQNELVRRGYKVFVPDLPGFGNTKFPDRPLTLTDYADFVEKFLATHKLKKIILIGHSFGGRISIKIASKNPKYLYSLVLTGAPGIVPVPRSKVLFFIYISKVGKILLSLPLFSLFKDKARKLLYRAAHATDFYNTNGKMRETFKNIVKEKLEVYLPKIYTPTLLLWGKEDKIVPVEIAVKMNELMRKSTLVAISDARHGLPWTNPQEFADAVEKFLGKI